MDSITRLGSLVSLFCMLRVRLARSICGPCSGRLQILVGWSEHLRPRGRCQMRASGAAVLNGCEERAAHFRRAHEAGLDRAREPRWIAGEKMCVHVDEPPVSLRKRRDHIVDAAMIRA